MGGDGGRRGAPVIVCTPAARLAERVPFTWERVTLDGVRSAAAYCVNGHFAVLSAHEIAPDGTVTPSVVCPEDECDWHEMVRLDGWEP